MCRNASSFNREGSEIYEAAMRLGQYTIDAARELVPDIELDTNVFEASDYVGPPLSPVVKAEPSASSRRRGRPLLKPATPLSRSQKKRRRLCP